MSVRHDIFPMPQLVSLREHFRPAEAEPESRYVFDKKKRLIDDESKVSVDCPKQTDRTAVLLVGGQSNAANHAGDRFGSKFGARIVNFFDGRCYIAVSPLLGSTESKGEYWTELANLLVASGSFDSVIIAPVAYDGTPVERWARGSDLNRVLLDAVGRLKATGYDVTDVLWHQGEFDYVVGTSEDAYRERLLSLVGTLRGEGVTAPIYVSIASKCLEPSNGGFKSHSSDNPIVRAQSALVSEEQNIRRGVNTDALLGDLDRFDDCHFGGSGAEKVARAWAEILLAARKGGTNAPPMPSIVP